MDNRENNNPNEGVGEDGGAAPLENLDELLESLRAGTIGINQASETEGSGPGDTDSGGEQPGSVQDGSDSPKKRGRRHKKKETPEENEPTVWWKELLSWIEVLVTAALIAFVIDRYIIANSQVPTGSMETTIMPGDRVIGSRLSYQFGEPERGDIAIFLYPDDADRGITTYYVKRVIGMPGDTIDIIGGKIYINGSDTPLDEPYLHEEMEPEPPQHYEVPEDSYFMMGDNRNHSNDSRRWKNKFVKSDQLVAKVLFQYFPKIRKLE